MPIGRATIMQIRGQYLIQDNHDDYTSQSAFSRGRGNVMCAHTYTHAHAIPSPHHDRSSSFFFSPPPCSFPPSHGFEMPRIAPRRGLVAKMHRCLSYNMLAMHLERERERGYIYLYLPGVSKVFPLEEEKIKKETFLLFLSSSFPRNEKSLVPERTFKETFEFISNFFSPSKPEQNRCAPHFLHVLTPSGGA